MASNEQHNLSALAGADGSDLSGIVIIERDLQGDTCIAWSFPNPGEATETALLAQIDFSRGTETCQTLLSHIGSQWAYRYQRSLSYAQ